MAKKNPKNSYICDKCKKANKEGNTHPGVRHLPGICDCECRNG